MREDKLELLCNIAEWCVNNNASFGRLVIHSRKYLPYWYEFLTTDRTAIYLAPFLRRIRNVPEDNFDMVHIPGYCESTMKVFEEILMQRFPEYYKVTA